MQICITKFVRAHRSHMFRFSDSIANSGLQNIGQVTWAFACDAMADEKQWLCGDLEALRSYFREFGAWDRDELAAMTGIELNALLAQLVAGDFIAREDAKERGELARYLETDGRALYGHRGNWYYYVGS